MFHYLSVVNNNANLMILKSYLYHISPFVSWTIETQISQLAPCFHLIGVAAAQIWMWFNISDTYCHTLRWRHNDHAGVSNHQPHGCLLNRWFRRKSKKTSKLRVTGLCAGKIHRSRGTGEFPAQMASYAENVSIWWRHHDRGKTRRNGEITRSQNWCTIILLGTIRRWWPS